MLDIRSKDPFRLSMKPGIERARLKHFLISKKYFTTNSNQPVHIISDCVSIITVGMSVVADCNISKYIFNSLRQIDKSVPAILIC